MSGVLINLIMTAMVFGVTIKTDRVRNYIDYALLLLIAYGVQIAVGTGIGALLANIWPGLPYGWGLMGVFAFWGGHGTVSAAGAVFEQFGITDNTGMGMILATIGLIVAIIVGMILVNWGIRNGEAKYLDKSGDKEGPQLSGTFPEEKRPSIGNQTVPSIGINSLALQLGWLLLSLFVGMKLVGWLCTLIPALSQIPTQVRGMIGAVIVWPVMCRLQLDRYADVKSVHTISNFCLELVVCSAIATLRLDLVTSYLVPIIILSAVQVVIMVFITLYICRHHVIGQDSGINIPGLLLVKGPHPRLVMVSADNNSQGRTVDVGCFADLRQPVLALDGDQVNRLEICGGGSHMSGLQYFLQLRPLYLLVAVTADGAACFRNRNEFHNILSFLNSLMAGNQECHLL